MIFSLFYPKKRIFFWSHGWYGKENTIKKLIGKLFYSFCDGAFIYNERSCQLMIKGGIPKYKLRTIYNSLDYDKQLSIRNSLEPLPIYKEYFGNDNPTIVFIGRLTNVKRFDLLIEAVALLKARNEQVNMIFIGDGEERSSMEQEVKQKDIDEQVWFYGACYDERRNAELIFNADLCVSPGNIGLTAMHVMMFGTPAITNNDFNHQMPEFEAIKEGETGSFFLAGDYTSLADTISQWLRNHKDDREIIRKKCYNVIDTKWNPHNQIKIFKETLLKSNKDMIKNQQKINGGGDLVLVSVLHYENECLTCRYAA